MQAFGSFTNLFAMVTSLSELYFRFRRFILLVQTKIVIFVNYGSSTSCRKPWRWVRLELILTMREMYINSNLNPLTKFLRRSRSTELKDILTRSMSQMILKTVLISTRIVKSFAVQRGILFWVCWKVSGTWDNNMIRISQWRENHYRANVSIRRKKKIQMSRTVTVTFRDPSRKVNHLSKFIWDREIVTVHQVYLFHQNWLVSLYDER